jgi:phosphoribosylformylglycinamidine synthase
MWSFSEVIDGMAEACRAFNTPVVSGNVSFYNETEGRGILPTPVIGMVGLVEDVRRIVQPGFRKENDVIALLGTTEDDLLMSEYSMSIGNVASADLISTGDVPKLNLDLERAVQNACLQAAEAGLLKSAHDCSDGGLAVAVAESCFTSPGHDSIGAAVDLGDELPTTTVLFSESPSRIVISFDPADRNSVQQIAQNIGAPFAIVGRVGGDLLSIKAGGETVVEASVNQLESGWRSALTSKLQAEALAAN